MEIYIIQLFMACIGNQHIINTSIEIDIFPQKDQDQNMHNFMINEGIYNKQQHQNSYHEENAIVLNKLKNILNTLIHQKQLIQKNHVKKITQINEIIKRKDQYIEKLNDEIKIKDKFIQLMFKENQILQDKLQCVNRMTKSSSVSNISASFFQTSPVLVKNYSKPSFKTRQSMPSTNYKFDQFQYQKNQSSPRRQIFENRLVNINSYFNDLKQKMQQHLKLINIQKQRWNSNHNIKEESIQMKELKKLRTTQSQQNLVQFKLQNQSPLKTQVKTSRSIYRINDTKTKEFYIQMDKLKSPVASNKKIKNNLQNINQNDQNKVVQKGERKNQPFFKRRKNVHEIQYLNFQHQRSCKQLSKA